MPSTSHIPTGQYPPHHNSSVSTPIVKPPPPIVPEHRITPPPHLPVSLTPRGGGKRTWTAFFARVLARLLWRFLTKIPLHHAQSKPNSKTDPSNRISTSEYPLNRAYNPERLLWRPRRRQPQSAARSPAKIFTRSRKAAQVTEHERPNGHRGRLPNGNSLYPPLPDPGPVPRKPDLVLSSPTDIPLPGPGERTECRPIPVKIHRSDEEVPCGGRSTIRRENREQTKPRRGHPRYAETGPGRTRRPCKSFPYT